MWDKLQAFASSTLGAQEKDPLQLENEQLREQLAIISDDFETLKAAHQNLQRELEEDPGQKVNDMLKAAYYRLQAEYQDLVKLKRVDADMERDDKVIEMEKIVEERHKLQQERLQLELQAAKLNGSEDLEGICKENVQLKAQLKKAESQILHLQKDNQRLQGVNDKQRLFKVVSDIKKLRGVQQQLEELKIFTHDIKLQSLLQHFQQFTNEKLLIASKLSENLSSSLLKSVKQTGNLKRQLEEADQDSQHELQKQISLYKQHIKSLLEENTKLKDDYNLINQSYIKLLEKSEKQNYTTQQPNIPQPIPQIAPEQKPIVKPPTPTTPPIPQQPAPTQLIQGPPIQTQDQPNPSDTQPRKSPSPPKETEPVQTPASAPPIRQGDSPPSSRPRTWNRIAQRKKQVKEDEIDLESILGSSLTGKLNHRK